jgi:penicillin-binding protein 1C
MEKVRIVKLLGQFLKPKFALGIVLLVVLAIYWTCLPKTPFNRSSSTILESRNNELLAASISKEGQWYFPASDSVPDKFKIALVQFEDRGFYQHQGVSIKALSRAFYQNIKNCRVVSGGSTIQMQLARMIRGRKGKKIRDKLYEMVMALRLTSVYSRDELLELYAANAPFGGNVIGIDAAAWRYYGHSSNSLTWAEATLLAVLPNAPSLIHPGKNRALLVAKRNRLLEQLYKEKLINQSDFELALLEQLPDKPKKLPQNAIHLLMQAKQRGQSGHRIHSSINKSYQTKLERIVKLHSNLLSENGVHNAAAVILDAHTGDVLAYVANSSIYVKHQKDVDMIMANRSTGSILKPLLYAEMLNEGSLSPYSLLFDIPTRIGGYAPKNYHKTFQGMVAAKDALSQSLNIPAVLMLQKYGVARFKASMTNHGLTTFSYPASRYGLSLILGGGEATLWELCQLYRFWTQQMHEIEPGKSEFVDILPKPMQKTALDKASIYLTFEAMSEVNRPDEEANWLEFENGRKVAWKTGTSFGFRDAWAIGVTPDFIVGVWTGNADGEGRPGLTGTQASAPILFQAFNMLPKTDWFEKPNSQLHHTKLCLLSGYKAGEFCVQKGSALLPKNGKNVPVCPFHKRIHLNNTAKFRVTGDCYPTYKMVHKNWFVLPPLAEKYYQSRQPNYAELPPWLPICKPEQELVMQFIYPQHNGEIMIPRLLNGKMSPVVFEATHQDENAILYWHLNELFLGTTKGVHQKTLVPPKGKQVLSVVDENGNQIRRKIEVYSSESQEE